MPPPVKDVLIGGKTKMRKFLENKAGNVQTIGAAVAILVTIMVSVLIVYNIAASIDANDIDTDLQSALSEGTDVVFAQVNLL